MVLFQSYVKVYQRVITPFWDTPKSPLNIVELPFTGRGEAIYCINCLAIVVPLCHVVNDDYWLSMAIKILYQWL